MVVRNRRSSISHCDRLSEVSLYHDPAKQLGVEDNLMRELAAEFLGTWVLIMFGVGVVAQSVLSNDTAGGALSVHIGWALGVFFGIIIAGGVSGAHLNPAVTFAYVLHGRVHWRKFAPYAIAQLMGAFTASLVVYLNYNQAFDAFDGGTRGVDGYECPCADSEEMTCCTAGIFATYPQPFLSVWGGLFDQIVGTGLLLMVLFALGDEQNNGDFPPFMKSVSVSLTVLGIGACFGFNCGYAINPARDLGPRIFTLCAGWGVDVFRAGSSWWWVPVIGPMVGAALGSTLYEVMIACHHPPDDSDSISEGERDRGRVYDELRLSLVGES